MVIGECTEGQAKELAIESRSLRDNEAAAVWQLKAMLAFGTLQSIIGGKPIRRIEYEYKLGSGRADIVLFHRDCGITIIEAKAAHNQGTIAAGIGQLFLYESEARQIMVGPHAPKYVHKVLSAPLHPEEAMPVWRACQIAGVKFVHLIRFKELAPLIARLARHH